MSSKNGVDDFTFVMTCLKHAGEMPKPNFEEVAKEVGAKNGNTCYHRLWRIQKNWGMTGNRRGTSSPTTPKSRSTTTKHPRATPSSKSKVGSNGTRFKQVKEEYKNNDHDGDDDDDDGDDDDENDEDKKIKVNSSESEAESPTLKRKRTEQDLTIKSEEIQDSDEENAEDEDD